MTHSDDSIYKSCIAVLGADSNHIAFQRLTQELRQEPILRFENVHVAYYDFQEYGIELIYKKSRACFGWAMFFVNTPHVRLGEMKPYPGTFFFGVTPNDSMSEIERKIDLVPVIGRVEAECTLRYDLAKEKVTFYFDGAGKRMSHVMVKGKRSVQKKEQSS